MRENHLTMSQSQQSRVAFARDALDEARRADLGAMSPSALILLVERLRGRLDDTLTLVDEVTQPPACDDSQP